MISTNPFHLEEPDSGHACISRKPPTHVTDIYIFQKASKSPKDAILGQSVTSCPSCPGIDMA